MVAAELGLGVLQRPTIQPDRMIQMHVAAFALPLLAFSLLGLQASAKLSATSLVCLRCHKLGLLPFATSKYHNILVDTHLALTRRNPLTHAQAACPTCNHTNSLHRRPPVKSQITTCSLKTQVH